MSVLRWPNSVRRPSPRGFLGRDNAQLFENLLARKRIDDQFIRIAGETRVGIKISDPESGKTTDINFPGIKLPATGADEIKSRLKSLLRPGQWVVLAGSVPPGVEPAIYATLCDLVHSAGGQVALDTSGPPLAAALAMRPALVKPNADELAELIGRPLRVPQDIVSAARQSLIDAGVTLAVVSMGGDGAIFVTANEAIRAHAPQVRVVSTVGAGDAMVAGLVFALSHKCPLEEAARLATALGTRAVSQPRHDGGTPTPYEPYLARVRIEKMS